MAAAGQEVLACYSPRDDSIDGWAEEIYRAMETVRRASIK